MYLSYLFKNCLVYNSFLLFQVDLSLTNILVSACTAPGLVLFLSCQSCTRWHTWWPLSVSFRFLLSKGVFPPYYRMKMYKTIFLSYINWIGFYCKVLLVDVLKSDIYLYTGVMKREFGYIIIIIIINMYLKWRSIIYTLVLNSVMHYFQCFNSKTKRI